jgi:TetR/AcrR family transcriptional regulator, transcriptional repressor of bet genes
MPRPSNTQERRREIASALARVMARTGYDGASIAAIAAEAGVAAGGVHYHFGSKAEILTDLVDRLVGVARSRIEARLERADTARDRLLAILDGLLDAGGDAEPDAVAVWSLIAAEAVRNEDVRGLYGGWLGQVADRLRASFVAACEEEGRSATGAPRAATSLVALVEGYYAVAAGAPGLIAAGSAAPAARHVALALLDQQPPRPA